MSLLLVCGLLLVFVGASGAGQEGSAEIAEAQGEPARDAAVGKAGVGTLVAVWGVIVVGMACAVASKRANRRWLMSLFRVVAILTAVWIPITMLSLSCGWYREALTEAGRTEIGWHITFWIVVCGILFSLFAFGFVSMVVLRTQASRRPSVETLRPQNAAGVSPVPADDSDRQVDGPEMGGSG